MNLTRKKKIGILVSLILSHLMCIVVSADYVSLLYRIQYEGASAPVWISFLTVIPFIILILISIGITFLK